MFSSVLRFTFFLGRKVLVDWWTSNNFNPGYKGTSSRNPVTKVCVWAVMRAERKVFEIFPKLSSRLYCKRTEFVLYMFHHCSIFKRFTTKWFLFKVCLLDVFFYVVVVGVFLLCHQNAQFLTLFWAGFWVLFLGSLNRGAGAGRRECIVHFGCIFSQSRGFAFLCI